MPAGRSHKAYCFQHEADCCIHPPKSGLRCEVAGSTCVAWSSRGKGEHLSHLESTLPVIVWLWTLRLERPELVVHECTEHFQVSLLIAAVGDLYDIHSKVDQRETCVVHCTRVGGGCITLRLIVQKHSRSSQGGVQTLSCGEVGDAGEHQVFSPVDIGLPTQRRRRYTIMGLRRKASQT
jgi:hypothetical protein